MKNRQMLIGIIFQISFLLIIESAPSSDPFYIIAHRVNNRTALDSALEQGANAIEHDIQFNSSGYPSVFENGRMLDCECLDLPGHNCHYDSSELLCTGSNTTRNIIEHVEDIATRPGIALYYIDSKFKIIDQFSLAGKNIIPFLDKHLFGRGYQGNVLISTPFIASFDYIQSAVIAAIGSINKNQYYFTFDAENYEYRNVISMLSRLTNKRIYSTHIERHLASNYLGRIKISTAGKSLGENGLTFTWTIDYEDRMKDSIEAGVNGIVTNEVADLKKVVQWFGLNLATSSTPIPSSNRYVPSENKCRCLGLKVPCRIIYPAPPKTACRCNSTFSFCEGFVVDCDHSHPKCINPDLSKESCELGKGLCKDYENE